MITFPVVSITVRFSQELKTARPSILKLQRLYKGEVVDIKNNNSVSKLKLYSQNKKGELKMSGNLDNFSLCSFLRFCCESKGRKGKAYARRPQSILH